MKAYVVPQYGEADVFSSVELLTPQVKPGHVLIQVIATSINPVDYKIRAGVLPGISPELPAVLHGDVAGVVEVVGEAVTEFQPGDEVYGCAGGVKGTSGALAEYMLVDAALIAKKPKSLSMAEAAALPLVSITAWEGLIDRARVQPGQTVLVYGGTGGVGHIGIQLASIAGATVYATVSNDDKALIALKSGADVTINYCEQNVQEYVEKYTNGKGFDVVFDTVGNENLANAFQAAALNGTVVSILALSTQDLTPVHVKGITLHVVFMLIPMLHGIGRARHGEILTKLAQLVDEGKVRPLLDSRLFSFSEIAAAHRYAESGQAIGKIIVTR